MPSAAKDSPPPPTLQVYSCHQTSHRLSDESLLVPTPPPHPAPTVEPPIHEPDLPIVIRKGICSTRNSPPHYTALSYHRLSQPFYTCISFISSIYIPKSIGDALHDRLKARFMAKGYTQIFGLDYGNNFSPVAKMTSVRLFIAMVVLQR